LKAALALGLWIAIVFGVLFVAGRRKWNRKARALAMRRPNPTRDEFVDLLREVAEPDAAEWLWNELLPYFEPTMSPHPDDDLIKDLPIDPDEPEDWVRDYCKRYGLTMRLLGKWPGGRSVTPRTLLEWLEGERRRIFAT
jgi:hypothetical protein